MTLLPNVRDELVAAASRRAQVEEARAPARRRLRPSMLLAAALSLTVAGTATGAILVATGVVGGKPSAPYPRIGGEERSGMTRTRAPVVLGTARMPTVGTVEVVGYTMRGYMGRGSLLCVDLVLPDASKGGGCDAGIPGRAEGTLGTGFARGSAPRLASGATRTPVDRVTVRYRVGRRAASSPATLVRVPPTLAARLDTLPFVYFVAEVPKAARSLVAVARNRDDIAWTARYPERRGAPR